MAEIRGVMGNASPILGGQRPQMMQRPLLTEPVLSPILTDTEISPLHRTGIGAAPGNGKTFVYTRGKSLLESWGTTFLPD